MVDADSIRAEDRVAVAVLVQISQHHPLRPFHGDVEAARAPVPADDSRGRRQHLVGVVSTVEDEVDVSVVVEVEAVDGADLAVAADIHVLPACIHGPGGEVVECVIDENVLSFRCEQ